ncbi:tetratricopeptide repeat-containing sensor histidine kinase [Pedobacter boryungensis]|uniref:histidine kinase n=1 Tax=Pedobacter boryungensis TaxID=869962 RepID=A0ABX2DGI9_9SPHI|nr:tetratricopeptide repeat protein [Pedobacter boryungensis]NQX33147.1 tetratricopeptide repeat protein [Pedobacter boryungensis]
MNFRFILTVVLICFSGFFLPCFAQHELIDSLKIVISRNTKDADQVNALNKLSTEYSRLDIKRAKQLLYQSISLNKSLNRADLLSYAYSHLAALLASTGKVDSANMYLSLLKSLSEQTKNTYANTAKGYYNYTAGLLLKQQGNYRAAIPYMNLGLKYFTADGDLSAIAAQHMSIGNTYIKLFEFKKALDAHLSSLRLFTKAGNKRGVSFSYQNIATDFYSMKMYAQALPYAKKAMELKTQLKDKRGIAGAAIGLGNAYEGLMDDKLALDYYKQALKVLRSLNLPQDEAELQVMIGNYYSRKNNFIQAKSSYERSLELATLAKDSSLIRSAEAKIASVNKSPSLNDEQILLRALHAASRDGDKSMEIDIYRYLSDYYSQKGQYKQALHYKNVYLEVSDKVHNNSLLLQLKSMEEQFRRERNIQEIAILKKDREINQVRLQKEKNLKFSAFVIVFLLLIILYVWIANQRARNMLQMQKLRDELSRDLHDDIGSRLTNIQFLTHISHQSDIDEKQKNMNLGNIRQEILASTQALDEIVWSMKTSPEDMDSLTVRIRRYTGILFEDDSIRVNIHIKENFPDDRIYHETQRDLFLMFKEILNNIIKHAHAHIVNIDLSYAKGRLYLKIIDNGVGFDASKISSKRNGLSNLKSRAEKWNGSFEIKSSPGMGTQALFIIPYNRISFRGFLNQLNRYNRSFLQRLNLSKD